MVHSLITLFPSTATKFDTNGLGSLGEAISCTVTEERNGGFELEMVYPVSGKHYKDIERRSILFVKPNPVDKPQAFRIYKFTKPMDGSVTYYAAHISYDLSGYPVNPFSAKSCDQAMVALKDNSVLDLPFEFRADVVTDGSIKVETPTPIRSVLGGSEQSILEIFGGEYRFNNFDIELLNHRGMNRGVVIRYGKNLTDIKQEESMEDVYTDILPYWYGEVDEIPTLVTLPELTIAASTSYNFHRILPLDMSSSFQEKPFVVDLREAANEWLKLNNPSIPYSSFDISFVQLEQLEEYSNLALLERVELCDEVTVEYPDFGISVLAKVTKTVYDVMAEKYTSITLGDAKSTLSQTVSGQEDEFKNTTDSLKDDLNNAKSEFNDSLDNAKDELNGNIDKAKEDFLNQLANTKTELEKATEAATEWITNGRGYMVAVKNEIGQWIEICSLDNPDIAKAINVWRWNNAGFGHSSHGYNGPYEVAITQDGKINAKFIVTGEMSANRIRGGMLLLGGPDNGNGYLNTKDQYGNDICTIDNYGLNISKGQIRGALIIIANEDTHTTSGYPTEIHMEESDIRFYEGDFTNTTIQSSYAGRIAPSEEIGGYWFGDQYHETEESFPGIVIDAEYLLRIKVESTDYMTCNNNSIKFNQDLYGDYMTLTGNFYARYGAFYESLYVAGLPVQGSIVVGSPGSPEDPSIVKVSSYGYSLLSPMKGDIGIGETDDDGICYIYLDDYANSAVNTSIEYYVFLQKEGKGDIWIKEKNAQYFIVEGTPNLKFSWELKGRQTGYEYERLEPVDEYGTKEENNEDLITEGITLKNELITTRIKDQLKEIDRLIKNREETVI